MKCFAAEQMMLCLGRSQLCLADRVMPRFLFHILAKRAPQGEVLTMSAYLPDGPYRATVRRTTGTGFGGLRDHSADWRAVKILV